MNSIMLREEAGEGGSQGGSEEGETPQGNRWVFSKWSQCLSVAELKNMYKDLEGNKLEM